MLLLDKRPLYWNIIIGTDIPRKSKTTSSDVRLGIEIPTCLKVLLVHFLQK